MKTKTTTATKKSERKRLQTSVAEIQHQSLFVMFLF